MVTSVGQSYKSPDYSGNPGSRHKVRAKKKNEQVQSWAAGNPPAMTVAASLAAQTPKAELPSRSKPCDRSPAT